jgi:hypothetical protein
MLVALVRFGYSTVYLCNLLLKITIIIIIIIIIRGLLKDSINVSAYIASTVG